MPRMYPIRLAGLGNAFCILYSFIGTGSIRVGGINGVAAIREGNVRGHPFQ